MRSCCDWAVLRLRRLTNELLIRRGDGDLLLNSEVIDLQLLVQLSAACAESTKEMVLLQTIFWRNFALRLSYSLESSKSQFRSRCTTLWQRMDNYIFLFSQTPRRIQRLSTCYWNVNRSLLLEFIYREASGKENVCSRAPFRVLLALYVTYYIYAIPNYLLSAQKMDTKPKLCLQY